MGDTVVPAAQFDARMQLLCRFTALLYCSDTLPHTFLACHNQSYCGEAQGNLV